MNEAKTCQWSGSINLFVLGAYKGFVFSVIRNLHIVRFDCQSVNRIINWI